GGECRLIPIDSHLRAYSRTSWFNRFVANLRSDDRGRPALPSAGFGAPPESWPEARASILCVQAAKTRSRVPAPDSLQAAFAHDRAHAVTPPCALESFLRYRPILRLNHPWNNYKNISVLTLPADIPFALAPKTSRDYGFSKKTRSRKSRETSDPLRLTHREKR